MKRPVSPSLREAAQLETHESHAQATFKMATQVAMTTLDTLAESQELTSNAYNRMAKRLKLVYDSRDSGLKRAKRNVVRDMASADPAVLSVAPLDVDWMSPSFVKDVIEARSRFTPVCDNYLQDLTDVYMGGADIEMYMGEADIDRVRHGMIALLLGDADLLGGFVLNKLLHRGQTRTSREVFRTVNSSCTCPLHNRSFGLMVNLVEAFPNSLFVKWMTASFDKKKDATLIRALRMAAGINPNPVCPSPSLRD
jgi:hypothetical protein